MPQGGIDEGETPRDAVLRECREEIGTDSIEILAESRDWYAYDFPEELISKVWGGKFRGQKQKWFALRFMGTDRDITIDRTDDPEFSDWKWVDIETVAALIVPFKRRVYEEVVGEFRPWAETIAKHP